MQKASHTHTLSISFIYHRITADLSRKKLQPTRHSVAAALPRSVIKGTRCSYL